MAHMQDRGVVVVTEVKRGITAAGGV